MGLARSVIESALRSVMERVGRKPAFQHRPSRLIVGLGNPGEEYRQTRHNVGFHVIEQLADRWHLSFHVPRNLSRLAYGLVAESPVALLQPLTYVNRSGESVAWVLNKLDLAPQDMLVVHDDIDLPLGRLRIRRGGSAGGHKGVQSIIDSVGSGEFARLRIGVGRPADGDVRAYVLSPFDACEAELVEGVISRAVGAIECYLRQGVEVAMNEYNRRV